MDSSSSLLKIIRENLNRITEAISRAAEAAGRDEREITLVVVSKGQDKPVVEAAVKVGIRNFGENYPEQAIEKIEMLNSIADIRWHMIGHLQSRKADIVVDKFDYVHSLDSLRLARRLDNKLSDVGKKLPVLLEFNVGREKSKYGWNVYQESRWDDLIPDISSILELESLQVRGLMCMPPYSGDPENSRSYFVRLRKLRDYFARLFPEHNWNELSMGTSFDFEVAVQEGATFVRVGQAILGPRPA